MRRGHGRGRCNRYDRRNHAGAVVRYRDGQCLLALVAHDLEIDGFAILVGTQYAHRMIKVFGFAAVDALDDIAILQAKCIVRWCPDD